MTQTDFEKEFERFLSFTLLKTEFTLENEFDMQNALDFSTYLRVRSQELKNLCNNYDPNFPYVSKICDSNGNILN